MYPTNFTDLTHEYQLVKLCFYEVYKLMYSREATWMEDFQLLTGRAYKDVSTRKYGSHYHTVVNISAFACNKTSLKSVSSALRLLLHVQCGSCHWTVHSLGTLISDVLCKLYQTLLINIIHHHNSHITSVFKDRSPETCSVKQWVYSSLIVRGLCRPSYKHYICRKTWTLCNTAHLKLYRSTCLLLPVWGWRGIKAKFVVTYSRFFCFVFFSHLCPANTFPLQLQR